MNALRRALHWLTGDLHGIHLRGAEQSREVEAALKRARQEAVNLQVAVQSRSQWT